MAQTMTSCFYEQIKQKKNMNVTYCALREAAVQSFPSSQSSAPSRTHQYLEILVLVRFSFCRKKSSINCIYKRICTKCTFLAWRLGVSQSHSQTDRQSLIQSVSQSVNHTMSQSVSRTDRQSLIQSVNHTMSQSVSRTDRQSLIQSVSQSHNESVSQSNRQTIPQTVRQIVRQPVSESVA